MTKPYIPLDTYAKKAKTENYRARSVYKLIELDRKFKLIKHGMKVLDIAAAPGSWAQYVTTKVGDTGFILAVDLQKIDPIAPNVQTEVCDINDALALSQAIAKTGVQKFDIVLSDIAPSTTGITGHDHGRSIELNREIVKISQQHLKPSGSIVLKVFEGAEFQQFVAELKKIFRKVDVTKVQASRDRSFEKYIVCSHLS